MRVSSAARPAQVWGEDTETPNLFHFHEEYRGIEGFNEHAATPHFAVWDEFALTDPFTMNMEVAAYTAVADDGD